MRFPLVPLIAALNGCGEPNLGPDELSPWDEEIISDALNADAANLCATSTDPRACNGLRAEYAKACILNSPERQNQKPDGSIVTIETRKKDGTPQAYDVLMHAYSDSAKARYGITGWDCAQQSWQQKRFAVTGDSYTATITGWIPDFNKDSKHKAP